MREKEATVKKCCAQVGDRLGQCIASECMAWRWISELVLIDDGDRRSPMITRPVLVNGEPSGYCGLAGRVES